MPPIGSTLSLDISSFRDNLAKAQVSITGFNRTTTQLQTSLKSLANSYSGANTIRQAELTAKAITQIGGVTKLTSTEVKRAAVTLDEYAAKVKALGQTVPAEIAKIRGELDKLNSSTGSGGGLMGSILGGLGVGSGAAVGMTALNALQSQLGSVAENARKLGAIQIPFERMSGGAASAALKLQALRTATNGLVSDAELMTASNRGTALGLDRMGISFSELARVSTILAQNMGQDVGQSLNDLSEGLSKGSAEVLNNVGVIVKADQAYEEYSRRLGKTKEELSAVEQQTAIAVIGFEQAKKKAEEFGDVPLTFSQKWDQITTVIGDILAKSANAVTAWTPFRDLLAEMAGFAISIRDALPNGAPKTPPGFGPGATSGQYGGSATTGARGSQPQYISAGPGAVTVVSAQTTAALKLRQEAAARNNAGITSAQAALDRAAQQRADAEKRIDEILIRSGFKNAPTPSPSKPRKASATETRQAQEAGKRIARETEDVVRSAQTTILTTMSAELWKGSSAMPSRSGNALTSSLFSRTTGLGALSGEWMSQMQRRQANWLTPGWSGVPPLASYGLGGGVQIGGAIQTSGILRDSSLFMRDAAATKTIKNIDRISTAFGGLSTSLSQLSQITGGLGPISEMFGSMASAFGSGSSIASLFTRRRDGETDSEFQARLGTNGGRVGALMSALSLGGSIGSMTTNPLLAGGLGAGSGALMGASMAGTLGMSAGLATGIGAVAVGGMAAYTAWKQRQNQKKALSESRQDFIETMGGLTKFQSTVERVGFSYEYFMSLFNSNKPETFRMAVSQLTAALGEETDRADKLSKSLSEVARVSGVVSQSQLAQIRTLKKGDPAIADVLSFDESQRSAAEAGLARAIAALRAQMTLSDSEIETLTRGVASTEERERVIEAALKSKAGAVLKDFGAGVRGAAAGLYASFAVAIEAGEDALTVLERLQPGIQTLQDIYNRTGQSPAAGFAQVQSYSKIATGKETGPALQIATGLGQALAGFQNTGLLSPELFTDLANGIGEAYTKLELLGSGGIDAARLMQPALQAIWQMIQDTPSLKDNLDPATAALIDFAEKSGIIGDKFRPAMDRMVDALDKLIARMDAYIQRLQEAMGLGNLPTPPTGAPGTGTGSNSPTNNGGEFASGTGLKLRNWGGAGTWIKVHNREGIMTERDVDNINARLMNAARPVMVGGGGFGSQQIVMMLDGREIGRSTLKGMPSQAAVYAGAF